MPPTPDQIAAALAYLDQLAAIPAPYQWGGSTWPPAGKGYGLDCSGAVCVALRHAGMVPAGFRERAHELAYRCDPVSAGDARPGDLVFYRRGKGRITHVMFLADGDRVIGAQGGGSRTTTAELARAADARVKYLPRSYREREIVTFGRWRG